MKFFEKYLSVWVLLCIIAGISLGKILGNSTTVLENWKIYTINIPVAVLVWMMIYPMMVQIDFSSISGVKKEWKGLMLTVIVNWLIKPFTMAFFGWIFFKNLFAALISPEDANQYMAGAILLGAAPCTAMVFVWSYLVKGNANYTLIQVSVNDLIILVAYVPIVKLLLGVTSLQIPFNVLIASVVVFVVIPLVSGYLSNQLVIKRKGRKWFEENFLPILRPISILALLSTLILLFTFQGEYILDHPYTILLIAIPLTIQTYFVFFITWLGGRLLRLSHPVCAPAAMIGASNFFELSVAVAISLFGLNSGAALATVVGVLIEVPVMLSLVALANRWRY